MFASVLLKPGHLELILKLSLTASKPAQLQKQTRSESNVLAQILFLFFTGNFIGYIGILLEFYPVSSWHG